MENTTTVNIIPQNVKPPRKKFYTRAAPSMDFRQSIPAVEA